MTFLQRLCVHFEYEPADLVAMYNQQFAPDCLPISVAKNMLKDTPKPVFLKYIKSLAIPLNCDYQELIYGVDGMAGIPVKF